ncbi:hypothetical protein FGU71_02080 [Erythrobacter insulae]|uniref:Uncharacterized protein n=1 Tax=Erythrobacter insulae TaxID=2584124 RepID=A0A547P9G8_9SPHN|nr:hypothetical protein [Erythrobacter insulae]TRD10773.1 hypothetical protein FGU71_02080 [Erythrobacter insulae]
MNIAKCTLAAATAALIATGSPALADDDLPEIEFETQIVKDREDVVLDPAKAYILLQSPVAIPATFFKVPTDEEREIVSNERAAALTKAHEKWVKEQAGYERHLATAQKRNEQPTRTKPIEPTEENFSWIPPEQQMMFSIGPLNRFEKGEGLSLYLQEVPAGEYVYYGTTNLGLGACACMGTVKFEAKPGTITALRYDGVWLDKNGDPIGRGKIPDGVDTNDALVRVAMIIEKVDDAAFDPRLPRDWIRDADLVPMPFVPNWLGAEINRIAPIPGVLRYERDEMIDVQAELAREQAEADRLAAEAAEAEARAKADAAAAAAEAEQAETEAEAATEG